ncbi:MAG TPA: hypothetical protein VLE49_21570 [Anaerolineales bacterium]|nr:hypothetical protein [Anaerolineales bacterium]
MNIPWIELDRYQDQDDFAGPGFPDYVWQALFACQIGVRSHQEWVKLRWGFNAAALFDEALERQKLFLESQYAIKRELGTENPNHRTLAFRYINRPGKGLVPAIIGKIHARTEAEAREDALAYCRELKSTFPYDYVLEPAASKEEFIQLSGMDILDDSNSQLDLAQIKRFEVPIYLDQSSYALQGFWQSGPRVHEQIWRSLAASVQPLLMNISIRCTVLYEEDRQRLLKCAEEVSQIASHEFLSQKTLSAYKSWNEMYIERRLAPWKKFFYLQIHLASNQKIEENFFRIVGTSLAWSTDSALPGYRVFSPKPHERPVWQRKLRNLDMIFSGSPLPVPRLAEVADMDEVFAVMRLPYSPPEDGFPDVTFAGTSTKQE